MLATSGCRWRSSERKPFRSLAGGPAAGGGVTPGQRGLLAAELRGTRRRRPARTARGRSRRICRGRRGQTCSRRRTRRRRRARRYARRRGGIHHWSLRALDLLLASWPPGRRTLACLPGEYGPNLAVMAAHGFARRPLPTDGEGRVAVDEAAIGLAADPPDLVHLTAEASHRGVVQPLHQMAQLCGELGLPLVVEAAQALGQVDCAAGADVTYASSRKWIAGPRGVGVLAVRPTLMQRLRPRLPPPD
jgi:Aminotransferase class-V